MQPYYEYAGITIYAADSDRTLLRVYNSIQKRWYETSLIACDEVGKP